MEDGSPSLVRETYAVAWQTLFAQAASEKRAELHIPKDRPPHLDSESNICRPPRCSESDVQTCVVLQSYAYEYEKNGTGNCPTSWRQNAARTMQAIAAERSLNSWWVGGLAISLWRVFTELLAVHGFLGKLE